MSVAKKAKVDAVGVEIIPGLFLGSIGAAQNKEWLQSAGITHVLTVASGLKSLYPDDFTYRTIALHDSPKAAADLASQFPTCFEFINQARSGFLPVSDIPLNVLHTSDPAAGSFSSQNGKDETAGVTVCSTESFVVVNTTTTGQQDTTNTLSSVTTSNGSTAVDNTVDSQLSEEKGETAVLQKQGKTEDSCCDDETVTQQTCNENNHCASSTNTPLAPTIIPSSPTGGETEACLAADTSCTKHPEGDNTTTTSTLNQPTSTTTDCQDSEPCRPHGGVLVHCFAGRSRSATVVVAYLMYHKHWTFESAMEYVRCLRPSIIPNPGFCAEMLKFQRELREANTELVVAEMPELPQQQPEEEQEDSNKPEQEYEETDPKNWVA